jgi:lysozyme family protein
MKFTKVARAGYTKLWREMIVHERRKAQANRAARKIAANKVRYAKVAIETGVPWWWIGITHYMESAGDFSRHLHNGDPLSHRTTHVPAGRPKTGSPPFTWEESAIDALNLKNLPKITDWSIPHALYQFERYNGFGYVAHNVNSPYIWSFSTHYSRGKYVSDGQWSSSAVSAQCGAAVLLWTLITQGVLNVSADMTEIVIGEDQPTSSASTSAPIQKGNTMTLKNFEPILTRLAPTAAGLLAGPLAELALRELSSILDLTDYSENTVTTKLSEQTPAALVDLLQRWESKVAVLGAPQSAPQQAVEAAPEVASIIDTLIGGGKLKGLKTLIGIAVYVIPHGLAAAGFLPELLNATTLSVVDYAAGFMVGAGLLDKLNRTMEIWQRPKTQA